MSRRASSARWVRGPAATSSSRPIGPAHPRRLRRASNARSVGCSARLRILVCWVAGRLEPPTDGSLVGWVLRGKPCLEVTLFPRDDHEPYEHNGWNERNQQRETVDPKRETELNKGEGEIDGIPAVAVGPCADDRCRGAVAWDGRASRPERANCGDEKGDGQDRNDGAHWPADRRRDEPYRPKEMKHQADCDRAQVDERRTNQPKVCDVRPGSSETAVISRIVYQAVSPPAVQLFLE